MSDQRPIFVDNRNGNTLNRALRNHFVTLFRDYDGRVSLDIASAYFNLGGFKLLAEELESATKVRLLLGAEPRPEAEAPQRQSGDPPEPRFTQNQVTDALRKLDDALRRSRDLLPFDLETDATVRRLLALLHGNKVEVRRYTRSFLHAKAYLFRVEQGGIVVGSSNLTSGGLHRNLELNLGHYSQPTVDRVHTWFDDLWTLAEVFDLAAIYDRLMDTFPPYLIYLRVLFALYGEELSAEQQETGEIPLTNFQQHGVWRALRILKRCGGVLIADGVGLGKTFLAGEIISQYRARRQRVLLVCPAALRDSTWKDFLHRFQLFVDCCSYEELANDNQLGGNYRHLRSGINDYALVIVDEAHNYRNPDSPARAGILRRLLMGPRRDVVLLSATPVNNSLWDLYHLLRYFIKQDAHLADRGLLSIRGRFQQAMRVDPFNLNPDLLYPIIDATTVKRTRQFIKRHYANDLITLPDGRRVPIQFPRPVASSINYDLEQVLPGFLTELEDALMPEDEHPKLTLARYQPDNYPAGQQEPAPDLAIVGLIRSGLLKRFESSVYAFAKTTEKMVRAHDVFLRGLDQGVVIKKDLLHELAAADDEEIIDEILDTTEQTEPASSYNVEALRRDVQADRMLLNAMWQRAKDIKPDRDPKLAALVQELAHIACDAKREAISSDDEQQKRKVLVFSFYEDTINWIENYLLPVIDRDQRVTCYRGRVVSVAGGDTRGGIPRRQAIYGFAPKSTGAPPHQDDRFDLLLTTDVLAEGMNLQQCRNIINYDLPWNPMRLVQRHGRIDRIGSPHDTVFLRTYFPDAQLDSLLKLEARVRRKLAQAAASVGVEVSPIQDGAQGEQSFSESREEIERLHKNDATIFERGGTASAAQTGEEYRQELRKALLKRGDEIRMLPWKAGSGIIKGECRGHFYCATVGARVYLRFVPAEGGEIVSEIGTCLRIIECVEDTPMVMPLDLKQTAFLAWHKAREHIFQAWAYETDPANLQPKVAPLNRRIAQHLRQYPPAAVDQSRVEKCLDAVEAPCSLREQKLLRRVFEKQFPTVESKSLAIIEEVERIGLEPFRAPEALPPIELEDIHLICWIAIERSENLP